MMKLPTKWIGLTVAVVVLTLGAVWWSGLLSASRTTASSKETAPASKSSIAVLRAKLDPVLVVTVEQLARVEPYYEAEIRSRVSGNVRRVFVDLGQRVSKGDILVELDVPDLDADLEKQESVIRQREQELELSKAGLRTAETQAEGAETSIALAESGVREATATKELRKKRLERFQILAARDAIGPDLVDESMRDHAASEAACDSAQANVLKAKAGFREKKASVEAAKTDINLKIALVDVAKKERDRVQTQLDFAKIRAPIDGVITSRKVDPGSFVNHAMVSGPGIMMITRSDLVTVSMRLPDTSAAFIGLNCPVTVTVDDLPGVTIQGLVTRFSPTIREEDRTMRVEVDLFNDTDESYNQFVTSVIARTLLPLQGMTTIDRLCTDPVAVSLLVGDRKSMSEPLPVHPTLTAGGNNTQRLIPGMIGSMKVELRQYRNAYVIPASAVYSRGGKSFLLLVRNGTTEEVPVKVQMNDGRVAKVAIISEDGPGSFARREVIRELTGQEDIVASRQQEIGVGQKVNIAPIKW